MVAIRIDDSSEVSRPRERAPSEHRDFSVAVAEDGSVHLTGAMDLAAVAPMTVGLEAISTPGDEVFVVDVSAIECCSCAGLAALAREHWRRVVAGPGVLVVGPVPAVRRVMTLSGFDGVVPVQRAIGMLDSRR